MKPKTRLNQKIEAWECQFEENGRWYITFKNLNQDKILAYKYRILRYKVKRAIDTLSICDFDITPFTSQLKTDLGFDLDKHNQVASVKQKQRDEERLITQIKREELEAKRLEELRIENEKKRLEKANNRNNKHNKRNHVNFKNTSVNATVTDFEMKIRKDIEAGIHKKKIKKKWNITNQEYSRYKRNANITH